MFSHIIAYYLERSICLEAEGKVDACLDAEDAQLDYMELQDFGNILPR